MRPAPEDQDRDAEIKDLDASGDAAGADMADQVTDVDTGPAEPRCALQEPAGEALATYAVGPWSVIVEPNTGAWVASGPGGEVIAPSACDEEGSSRLKVAEGRPDVRSIFGSWRIDVDVRAMRWRGLVTSAPQAIPSGDTLTLRWPLEGEGDEQVELVFSLRDGEHLDLQLETSLQGATGGELVTRCAEGEGFFGLGTQTVGMDLRGGTYPLWTQEQGIDKPEDGGFFPLQNYPEAAYAPMGVLHSSSGYSALLKPDSFTELDLCEGDSEAVRTTTYRQMPGWVFLAGATPRERITSLTEYTGRITAPARWTFAPWNDTVGGPERVAEVARVLRENRIPSSAIWTEDWIGGELTGNGYRLSYAWEWDEQSYPNLPQDIERLHQQGFAFLAYFNTFVVSTSRMWQEAIENDYLIERADGEPYTFLDPAFRDASLVDLTHPGARAWLKGYLVRAASELAIDGWMADFTEWLPHDAVLHSGEDAWLVHNRFPLLWQELNREVFTEVHASEARPNDWVFWVRSGWASLQGGSGGLTPTMWGGDQNTDWGYDDGLPTVVPIGAHVGLSGVPIFGSDIAGYSWLGEGDELSTKELFLRWTALGAFHPLMRTHQGAAKCRNWSFDRDQDTLSHYKRYASIHTLLLPYFQILAEEAERLGWPITRHPYMVEPEHRESWQRERHYAHYLGDDLLVAPALEQGATAREVTLAPGALWWHLLGDERGERLGRSGLIEAPVTEIPVFVRGGTIVPLLGEVVDSFYGAETPGVTDLSSIEGQYRLALYGSERGELEALEFGPREARVTASGRGFDRDWMEGELDWTEARLAPDQAPLPRCAEVDEAQSCAEADRFRVVFEEAGALTVSFEGGARLELGSSARGVRLELYRGSRAWGELRQVTALQQGLDSMAPPVCVNASE